MPSGSSRFPSKFCKHFLSVPAALYNPVFLILLDLCTQITFGEEYKLWNSSLCSFHHSPVTFSLLGTICFPQYPFSSTLNLCSSFNMPIQNRKWKYILVIVKVNLSLCITKYRAMKLIHCVIKYQAIKTYWGSRSIDPRILNLGSNNNNLRRYKRCGAKTEFKQYQFSVQQQKKPQTVASKYWKLAHYYVTKEQSLLTDVTSFVRKFLTT
jgi:hypothetical protein